ncbi:MAG: M48 family metallopeptidase [Erythrobacter sp.]|nr:M48 family metallopeptidase [Erythrobacter sp.]
MIEWLRANPSDPEIELLGRILPIHIARHARARRLTMRLSPDGSAVRITLPRWSRSAEAVRFANDRRDWLEAQLAKVPAREDPVTRGSLSFRGRSLTIDWREDAPRRPALSDDRLTLGGPHETLSQRLSRWLESEAQRLMADDLAFYCERANIAAPPLRLSRAQRRWGSCSSSGTVRINWRLIQAPDKVRRSVVAHETAHLVHFDHSPAFHALLAAIYEDDLGAADSWLRNHGRTLYADFG